GPMEIRRATSADVPLVVEILAEAFIDDPFMSWMFPDARRRPVLAAHYFRSITSGLYLRHREMFLNAEHGTLICLPVGIRADALPLRTFLGMFWRMLWAHGFAGLNRARIAQDVLKANHPKEPHYYLPALGMRKERQGQGVGTALMRHVTQECDRAKVLSYLENSNEHNTPLYERMGFRTVAEWRAPGGPTLWFMRREPSQDAPVAE